MSMCSAKTPTNVCAYSCKIAARTTDYHGSTGPSVVRGALSSLSNCGLFFMSGVLNILGLLAKVQVLDVKGLQLDSQEQNQ